MAKCCSTHRHISSCEGRRYHGNSSADVQCYGNVWIWCKACDINRTDVNDRQTRTPKHGHCHANALSWLAKHIWLISPEGEGLCSDRHTEYSVGIMSNSSTVNQVVDCVWNVMAHAQKPDFVFLRNERVHLNRRGRQFSRLLVAELCASAVVMLDTPCSVVVWRVLATYSIRQFPPSLPLPCVTVCHHISTGLYIKQPQGLAI